MEKTQNPEPFDLVSRPGSASWNPPLIMVASCRAYHVPGTVLSVMHHSQSWMVVQIFIPILPVSQLGEVTCPKSHS